MKTDNIIILICIYIPVFTIVIVFFIREMNRKIKK
jgi:hypothetical protein